MRIAFIIMAHKYPAQILRLVQKLNHPAFDLYLHIDAKISIEQFYALKKIPNLFFLTKRYECNWGGFSFLKATIMCLDEILSSNKKYNFINLISGQDYPLYSENYIYNFFEQRKESLFISYEESNESNWWKEASDRYEKYHLTDFTFKGKFFIERSINAITPKRKFPNNMKLYGGNKSCWWTLTDNCAEYLVSELKSKSKFTNFLKLCWGTDEFVIPTLIMNSSFKDKVVNNNLRYIDWSEKNAHPRILGIANFKDIVNSDMLFARKFDINFDYQILEMIDNNIQRKELGLL